MRATREVAALRLFDNTLRVTQEVGGLTLGGDVEQALAGIPVPSYVLDTNGVVRWVWADLMAAGQLESKLAAAGVPRRRARSAR